MILLVRTQITILITLPENLKQSVEAVKWRQPARGVTPIWKMLTAVKFLTKADNFQFYFFSIEDKGDHFHSVMFSLTNFIVIVFRMCKRKY